MDKSEFGQIAIWINDSSDFEFGEVLVQLRALVEGSKVDGGWTEFKKSPDLQNVVESLQRRQETAVDDSVVAACLYALHDLDSFSNAEYVLVALQRATRNLKRADHRLFAAVRLALAAELISDEDYLDAVGGAHLSAMSSFDVDKHVRVAEKILQLRGVASNP
jgi:hypothetical protein